jgi:hypothetical protein
MRNFEISLMDPCVGSIFNTSFDRQSFVMRSNIPDIGIGIQNTGPNQRSSLFRLHCNIQICKARTTSFFCLVQIQEYCQNTNTLGTFGMVFDIICNESGIRTDVCKRSRYPFFFRLQNKTGIYKLTMVASIELCFFVLKQLQIFIVCFGNPS